MHTWFHYNISTMKTTKNYYIIVAFMCLCRRFRAVREAAFVCLCVCECFCFKVNQSKQKATVHNTLLLFFVGMTCNWEQEQSTNCQECIHKNLWKIYLYKRNNVNRSNDLSFSQVQMLSCVLLYICTDASCPLWTEKKTRRMTINFRNEERKKRSIFSKEKDKFWHFGWSKSILRNEKRLRFCPVSIRVTSNDANVVKQKLVSSFVCKRQTILLPFDIEKCMCIQTTKRAKFLILAI